MKTKILSLFFTFSFLTPNLSFAFTKSECRDCTKEVKDQVADIRKSFKLSKKADVVVLHPGEKGAQELKEIVEGNKIDETDVVLVPLEGEADKNEKKHNEGYVVAVKNLSKYAGGLLGGAAGFFIGILLDTLQTQFKITDHFEFDITNNAVYVIGTTLISTGTMVGLPLGKQFGKWIVTKLPQKEEVKKSTEQSTPAPSSSDTPASN